MGVFDSKFFNSEVFGKYMETVPKVKQNALLKAGVMNVRNDLKTMLADQTGGNYVTVRMTGLLGGAALNYDGNTNITAGNLPTFAQSMIVVGRAKAWTERDFSFDMTGKDFMQEIGAQVASYWDDVDQETMLAILAGVFNMSNSFAAEHTHTESANMTATSMNDAIQKAAGANKNIFRAAIMHSSVSTNLENLQLLSYTQYTDAEGIKKDMALATWNGRTVLIDDDVPVTSGGDYVTYLLGAGAFDYCDCGAKVPYETARDAAAHGGEDTLYTRQRKLFAPRGISFVTNTIISPTNTQLESGANWDVVKDTTGSVEFDHKAIPIARILSKG